MSSPGQAAFKLTFELSPIILTNGIAANLEGGALPIISLTESANFDIGIIESQDTAGLDLDNFFANYTPMPGATLIDQDVGTYPFANQTVAANAVITKGLVISFRMICPAKRPDGYNEKLAIMTSLQASLQRHNASGGTYILATPSAYYENCLMTAIRDISAGESAQAQTDWQLDFYKPLLTLQDAQAAQNTLMSKISSGTQIVGNPAWSSIPPTVGNPSSLAGPNVVPAAQNVGGAGIAGLRGFDF